MADDYEIDEDEFVLLYAEDDSLSRVIRRSQISMAACTAGSATITLVVDGITTAIRCPTEGFTDAALFLFGTKKKKRTEKKK